MNSWQWRVNTSGAGFPWTPSLWISSTGRAQGDFKFEPRDWPDPQAMVRELKSLGIETVVSVWPTIDERSENFGEMADKGMLVSGRPGQRSAHDLDGQYRVL